MATDHEAEARAALPVPDRPYQGELPLDAKDPSAKFPPIESLRPPAGAPNVLIVLIDDVGFAASSAFGGPCETPTAKRLAANGLKYNRFHTTALDIAEAAEDLDHLISPEERFAIAMARQ